MALKSNEQHFVGLVDRATSDKRKDEQVFCLFRSYLFVFDCLFDNFMESIFKFCFSLYGIHNLFWKG